MSRPSHRFSQTVRQRQAPSSPIVHQTSFRPTSGHGVGVHFPGHNQRSGQISNVNPTRQAPTPTKQELRLADSLKNLKREIPQFDKLFATPGSGFRDAFLQVNKNLLKQTVAEPKEDQGQSSNEWRIKEHTLLTEISQLTEQVQLLQRNTKVSRSDKGYVDSAKYEKEIERLKQENLDFSKQLQSTKEEKNLLLHRLSKLAGAKLSDNNPDITDLSDPNRPQKLAQMYNELYDNVHSEAFESFPKSDDKGKAHVLLDMFMEIWRFCRNLGHHQLVSMENLMLHPWLTTYEGPKGSQGDSYQTEIMKTIKDVRKIAAKETRKKLYQHFLHENPRYGSYNKEVSHYAEECLKLCWLCAIQDPSIEFMYSVKEGEVIDSKYFRKYDRSGDIVEYLLWPAMLLHKEGPVLSRGIVQVFKKKK
ncbi:uncharacterized protein LOC117329550 [Pecten maximus]|uniref:uncharacterized protein LOC117329550 n=1 Tax=Pecten maximus TaxID=6579 RepID=UPI001458563C|nr:uncharacterized protein LOC117329550 [Pecten maximus]